MELPLSLIDRIDALLPQTQCTKCGHGGCRPYAEAMASGAAAINRCPPGGAAGIEQLARLLGRAPLPLDPACGQELPLTVAVIDEALCIGCTLCIQACPVDAILGAARRMHTVIPQYCTGCDLCVAPCPMDCIAMVPVAPPRAWTPADARAARERFDARRARLAREQQANDARLAALAAAGGAAPAGSAWSADDRARKQAAVQAALERARARRRAQEAPA